MASSTRQSKSELIETVAATLDSAELRISGELLLASASLHSSVQLRNALSDPSAQSDSKQKLIAAVFGAKMHPTTVQVLNQIVAKRWSSSRDIANTAELFAVRLVASLVSKKGGIRPLLDELFQVQQILDSDADLELAVSSSQASTDQKRSLLKSIFSGKLSAEAELLVVESVGSRSSKRAADVLSGYADIIAEFANESVAEVRVARPLTADQQSRLQSALSSKFNRKLSINVVLDDSVVGGVRVAVGGQVLDATLQTKINHARLQLA